MITETWPLGLKVQPVQMSTQTAAVRELASWMQALLSNNGNAVMSGFGIAPSGSGSPIQYSVGSGILFLSGYWQSISGVTLSFNNNSDASNHRLDAIVGQYGQVSGTDSANNTTTVDTFTITKVQGAPATPALLPTLGANQVLLGWIDLAPNAASTANCTVNQPSTIYSRTLSDLSAHINASILTSSVHGVQATSAGGTEASRLAQTDTSGNVGRAKALAAGTVAAGDLSVNGRILGQAAAGTGDVLLIGNDSKLVDTNDTSMCGLYGQVAATQGGLRLGNAGAYLFGNGANLGVNTTGPSYTLDVNGTLHASTGILGVLNDGGGTGRGFGTPGSVTANVFPVTDSNGAVGLANAVRNGGVTLKMASGRIASQTWPNGGTRTTISLPAGLFSTTPSIVLTPTGLPLSPNEYFFLGTQNESATQFDAIIVTTNNVAAFGVAWAAIGT